MNVTQVVDVLEIANNDLPVIEERFKRLRNDVSMLEFRKHILERNLYQLNNQIAITSRLLSYLHISYKRERKEIGNLYNEKTRLAALISSFKNDNEYNKIKQAAEEKVKDVLTDSKLLLQFAVASVIESLRSKSELYNFISYSTSVETSTSNTYGSNYFSLISGLQHQQQSFNDRYAALILKEAEKLYNELTIELTNSVIAAAAAMKSSLRYQHIITAEINP